MPRLLLEKAVPGQKLARPITNATGMLVMPAGAELTFSVIVRLRAQGIEAVVVEADGSTTAGDGGSVEGRLQELEARFAGHEDDAWMMQLKAIVRRQIVSPGEVDDA